MRFVVPLACLSMVLVVQARADTEVTACGYPYSGRAFLTGDLDCTESTFYAVALLQGGTLDLAGFTLTAGAGVKCADDKLPCTVTSSVPGGRLVGPLPATPGYDNGVLSFAGVRVVNATITNFAGNGVDAIKRVVLDNATISANGGHGVESGLDVHVANSTISDNGYRGINVGKGASVKIEGSFVTGNGLEGVGFPRILKLKDSTVAGNAGNGIRLDAFDAAPKAVLRGCTIDGNAGHGIDVAMHPSKVTIRSCSFDGNAGNGVSGAKKVSARDSTFNDNGATGIDSAAGSGCRIRLTDCEVTGNGRFGVHAGRDETACTEAKARVNGSTLAGNATDASCFVTNSCADVASDTLPKLDVATTCEHSYVAGSGFPGETWGVCALD